MTQLVIQGSQSVASKSAQRVRGKISFNARKATQGEIINRTARSVGGRGEALAETCWAGGRGALRLSTAPPRGQGGAQSGLGDPGVSLQVGEGPAFLQWSQHKRLRKALGGDDGVFRSGAGATGASGAAGPGRGPRSRIPGPPGAGRAGHACSVTACRGRSRAEAHREPDAAGSGPLPARGGSPRAEWTGSGSRTDVSSVIELCALDHRIIFFCVCDCFCRDFFKNK